MDVRIIELFNRYLSNNVTEIEKKELNDWLTGDEFREWFTTQFNKSCNMMDENKKSLILEKIHEKIGYTKKPRFTLPTWIKSVAAAVVLVLLTVGGTMLYVQNNLKGEVQYAEVGALRGQKANIVLPDGTEVTLNSESKLRYSTNFNKSERHVQLNGEAFFEVAKNKKIPFIVQAGDLEVKAVGTAFNVKGYEEDDYISTTLAEGKVIVNSKNVKMLMKPNERIEYNTKEKTFKKVELVSAINSLGWLSDKLSFENATLEEVVANLSRNYNINILIASQSIKKQRFTGTVSNNSLQSVLKIISLSAPVRFEQKGSTVILREVPEENQLFIKKKN